MKPSHMLPAVLVALWTPLAAAAQNPSADHFFRPGSVAVSLYGGGGAFSKLHRVEGDGGQGDGADIVVQTSSALAGEAVWWPTTRIGVRLHGSFLPSRFDVRNGRDESALAAGTASGTGAWRGVHVWLADASLLVRPPVTFGRVAPYAVIGGGIVSYRARGPEALPPGLDAALESGTRNVGAAVIGAGAVVPLERERLLLSFAVTNHLTRPLIRSEFGPSRTSHVRLLAGITIPLRTGL